MKTTLRGRRNEPRRFIDIFCASRCRRRRYEAGTAQVAVDVCAPLDGTAYHPRRIDLPDISGHAAWHQTALRLATRFSYLLFDDRSVRPSLGWSLGRVGVLAECQTHKSQHLRARSLP